VHVGVRANRQRAEALPEVLREAEAADEAAGRREPASDWGGGGKPARVNGHAPKATPESYATVIAELKAKRAQLDAAIPALEALSAA
jgi:hypothetical protein